MPTSRMRTPPRRPTRSLAPQPMQQPPDIMTAINSMRPPGAGGFDEIQGVSSGPQPAPMSGDVGQMGPGGDGYGNYDNMVGKYPLGGPQITPQPAGPLNRLGQPRPEGWSPGYFRDRNAAAAGGVAGPSATPEAAPDPSAGGGFAPAGQPQPAFGNKPLIGGPGMQALMGGGMPGGTAGPAIPGMDPLAARRQAIQSRMRGMVGRASF